MELLGKKKDFFQPGWAWKKGKRCGTCACVEFLERAIYYINDFVSSYIFSIFAL